MGAGFCCKAGDGKSGTIRLLIRFAYGRTLFVDIPRPTQNN
jgi:hypothetical protein